MAALLAPHLTEENVQKLLSDCGGMSKRQTEEYLAALRPKPVFPPSIRKSFSIPRETQRFLPSPPEVQEGVAPPTPAPRKPANVLQPAEPQIYNFRFSADRDFKEKVERLAEVLDVPNPLQQMAEILEQAMDIALDKKDPKRKRDRRLKKAAKHSKTSEEKARPDEVDSNQKRAPSRHIPEAVRERVFARSGGQCEFEARDRTRVPRPNGPSNRAREALCRVWHSRREISRSSMETPQFMERRAGVRNRVHSAED